MIYSVSVEVLGHLLEAGTPPRIAVLRHLLPVVCREAPELSHDREVVGRSTGRRVHVEQRRIDPRIDARAAHADRYVTFQHHTAAMGIVPHLAQLAREMILHEVVVGHLVVMLLFILCGFGRAVTRHGAPFRKVGRRVLVPQCAEHRVRAQPILVGLHE